MDDTPHYDALECLTLLAARRFRSAAEDFAHDPEAAQALRDTAEELEQANAGRREAELLLQLHPACRERWPA